MKWSLKKYINNNIPLILIYLIIVIFIIYQIIHGSDLINEQFTNTNTSNKTYQIYSFILNKHKIDDLIELSSKNNNDLSHTPYIACFIPNSNEDIKSNDWKGNLIKTAALNSPNSWEIIDNCKIPDKIIVDLSYTKDGRLSCIAMGKYNSNTNIKPEKCLNDTIFNYYEKESSSPESNWKKIDDANNNECDFFMRSIVYDYDNFKLLGVNSNNGQIYEKSFTSNFTYTNWNGPINPDIPMKKIMFDKADHLIGIGLLDNFIYRKSSKYWYSSQWDKENINKFKVHDLLYYKDACLIASTDNGFYKQKYPDFSSKFEKYIDNLNNSTIELSITNILKYRTGYEYLDLLFNSNQNDEKILQQLYENKKLTTYLCKNRKNKSIMKNNVSKSQFQKIDKNNDTINNLYKMISQINDSLNV